MIPKDRQIIIEIAYGTYVAMYNPVDEKFVYANPQCDLYDGVFQDMYYENERVEKSEILKWRELYDNK